MKYLSIIFLILFSFLSVAKADDIKDFQIDGISIGDSLLDYFTKETIDNKKYTPWRNKKTYYQFDFIKKSQKYDGNTYSFSQDDDEYKIEEVTGRKFLDYSSCKNLQKEITLEIETLFSSADKDDRGEVKHRIDKSKKTVQTVINYILKDGSYIHTSCVKWSNKIKNSKGWKDSLIVAIASAKFVEWQKNKAF